MCLSPIECHTFCNKRLIWFVGCDYHPQLRFILSRLQLLEHFQLTVSKLHCACICCLIIEVMETCGVTRSFGRGMKNIEEKTMTGKLFYLAPPSLLSKSPQSICNSKCGFLWFAFFLCIPPKFSGLQQMSSASWASALVSVLEWSSTFNQCYQKQRTMFFLNGKNMKKIRHFLRQSRNMSLCMV